MLTADLRAQREQILLEHVEAENNNDVDAVIAELEKSGSLTPALNYYRANIPPQALIDPPLELPAVQASTMGVWSTGDIALTEKQMTGSAAQMSGPWRCWHSFIPSG